MQDNKHRNYDYVPTVSKQVQMALDLENEIRWLLKHAKLKQEDSFMLGRMLKKLEVNHNKTQLRSMSKKFKVIQDRYQKR